MAFEHPRDSELWNKPDVKELLQMPHFQEVDFDMCSFGLKAVSDGGLLKKPTKVMCTDPGYAAALHTGPALEIMNTPSPLDKTLNRPLHRTVRQGGEGTQVHEKRAQEDMGLPDNSTPWRGWTRPRRTTTGGHLRT